MRILLIPIFLFSVFFSACENTKVATEENHTKLEVNPAAKDFDLEGSDPEAIEIADEVMEAMGGRANYDASRYFTWDFFGFRTHIWDKQSGDVRIENKKNGALFLFNIHSMEGKAFVRGEEITEADSLAKMLKKGKSAWINDAYWLIMPFKLKDSGVTLSYVGEDTTQAGTAADVLELRFKEVGDTPQNKYRVWVEKSPRLITQWAFYAAREDAEARFITPWINYEKHGKILLSGDRGKRKLTAIKVMENVDPEVFTQP